MKRSRLHVFVFIAAMTLVALTLVALSVEAAGVSGSLSGGDTVKLERGVDETRTITYSLTNTDNQDASVDVDFTESYFDISVSPTSDSLTISPGQTKTVTATVTIDGWTSEGSYTVSASCTATVNGTGVDCTGDSVTFTVDHPVEVRVTGIAGNDLTQGNHTFDLTMEELWGWEDVDIQSATPDECRVSGESAPDWSVEVDLDPFAFVDAGTSSNVGDVIVTVPSISEPKLYGYDAPVRCDIEIDHDKGTNTAAVSLDAYVPPALEIQFSDKVEFLFDKPKSPSRTFSQEVRFTVENFGDDATTTDIDLTPSNRPATLEASSRTFDAERKTRVTGELILQSSHPEGPFKPSVDVGDPFIASRLDYEVVFAARITPVTSTLDFEDVLIGENNIQTFEIREELGYLDVPLELAVEPADETSAIVLPRAGETAKVEAGKTTGVQVSLAPPLRRSPPGCNLGWSLTWVPLVERPQLESFDFHGSARLVLANVDKARNVLPWLDLDNPEPVQNVLTEAAQECGKGDAAEAVTVANAVVTLHNLTEGVDGLGPSGGLSEAPRMLVLAMRARALDDVFDDSGFRSTDALEPKYREVRQDLLGRIREATEAPAYPIEPETVDQLATIESALKILGEDASDVKALKEQVLTRVRVRFDQALLSVSDLFEVPNRAPTGIPVSAGTRVNPNPFNWITLDRLSDSTTRNVETAQSFLQDLGPLGERVSKAETDAQAVIQQGRAALMMGSIVNAVFAVGLVGFGGRTVFLYLRDLEEVTLGSEILG